MGLVTVGGVAAGFATLAAARARNPYYSGPVSDHFDGVRFFNPDGHPPRGFYELLKWQIGDRPPPWPVEYPSPFKDHPPPRIEGKSLRTSFVGHATVLIQTAGLNILTDPLWSQRCSPFRWAGPRRKNPPGIDFASLPPVDVVLLSHNHYDHLDLPTLERLRQEHDPLIVTPLGNDTILRRRHAGFRIATGDWGDEIDLGREVRVTFEPAHHWSARGMSDRRCALWSAFMVQGPAGNIYHVGDTGFHDGRHYRAVREKYGAIRLAILPFGAFEPRDFMQHQHQNPDEAVRGHLLCGAQFTLGHHWGTFQLTNESIEDQLGHLAEARRTHGIGDDVFRALQPGQHWDVPEAAPSP